MCIYTALYISAGPLGPPGCEECYMCYKTFDVTIVTFPSLIAYCWLLTVYSTGQEKHFAPNFG